MNEISNLLVKFQSNMTKEKAGRIELVKRRLLRDSLPRIEVSIILLFTSLAGFLTSFSLLQWGVSSMTLRYPTAISVAYAVFLLLLRVWLRLKESGISSGLDFDIPINFDSSDSSRENGNLDLSVDSVFDGGGFDFDLEELWLVILAVVAIIGGLLAALYIIYIAPILLAEILVDGVLIGGLYKSLKGVEPTHWLQTAVKRTIIPAILAALFFTAAGFAMQKVVPQARSIGEIWNFQSSDKQ